MSDLVKKPEQVGTELQSAIIELVKRPDIDPDRLEKFLDLQIKMEDRQAEIAFNQAMAQFQSECPIIKKTKKVNFTASSGKVTNYNYSPLDEIVHITRPIMSKLGLSFSFDIEPSSSDGTALLVTYIAHNQGYTKKFNWFYQEIHDDTRMNLSQRRKSSLSFAKRAALENALGIVTAEEDDDARRAIDRIATDEQIKEIKELATLTKTEDASLLSFLKVEKIEDLSDYEATKAIRALKIKRAAK